jgi:outer membrane protein assembly factor BamB
MGQRLPKLVSRRAVLKGLTGSVIGARTVLAQTRRFSKPKPLAKDAVTHDWTAFLGPTHNAVSTETRLSRRPQPPLVWEFTKGTGYTSPAIAGERLVFLHRLRGEEIVECLHAESGATNWQFRYPSDFEDRYGYNDGPRSSPVIDAGRAYTVGAQGQLHCLELETGRMIWNRDLDKEYRVPQDFFGRASAPLIEGPHVIVNVGAPGGPCVVGFDKTTGREVWRAGTEWGAGYASPVPAVVHGKRRVFVFAGGESQPPSGGLMSIDPTNGRVDFSFPWRSRAYESVNASCPVVFDNKVFISASYRAGGALIEVRPDFTHRLLWTTQEFGLHFNTPIYKEGYLYGFDGRNESDASLACVDASSGRVVWRTSPEWEELILSSGQPQRQMVGTYRGSLLAVDGQFLCLGELGHLLWMDLTPKGYKEVSRARLFMARESWALPVLSRGLLYVVQNTRDFMSGARPRLLCYDLRA